MMTLFVLLGVFALALLVNQGMYGAFAVGQSGRVAMAAMLVFTGISHFVFTAGMAMMIPPFLPFRTELVYLTGILEVAASVGLLLPRWRVLTGWLLIVFFICILPANVYAAMQHINIQAATLDGNGLDYLWFRVPLQVLFIAWTYTSAIRLR